MCSDCGYAFLQITYGGATFEVGATTEFSPLVGILARRTEVVATEALDEVWRRARPTLFNRRWSVSWTPAGTTAPIEGEWSPRGDQKTFDVVWKGAPAATDVVVVRKLEENQGQWRIRVSYEFERTHAVFHGWVALRPHEGRLMAMGGASDGGDFLVTFP